jgi:hypothetical protein
MFIPANATALMVKAHANGQDPCDKEIRVVIECKLVKNDKLFAC